jgi:glycosyltransferase involved in cell wall biosynthesis
MKLIYLYVTNGCCEEGANIKWDSTALSCNHFATSLQEEGPFCMLQKLATNFSFFSAFITVIDSMRGSGSYFPDTNSKVFVVPHIKEVLNIIRPEDILFVRGGFKQWFSTLDIIYKKRENWILFYRANTNREKWPFWDVILEDLTDTMAVKGGRLVYPFNKPVNDSLFGLPKVIVPRKYDIMINASHIHVKKGQHLAVQAIELLNKKYNTNLTCVLPGRFIKSETNKIILDAINTGTVSIHLPGMIPRRNLNYLMNESKIFVHVGAGGQNDRGALEAMRCGLPLVIASPSRFSSFLSSNKEFCTVVNNDIENIADGIWGTLQKEKEIGASLHTEIAKYYTDHNSMSVAINTLIPLLAFMDKTPIPNRQLLVENFLNA